MSLSLRSTIVRSFLLAGAVAGCNSILDNQPGKLQEKVTPAVEQNQPSVDGGTPVNTEPVKEPAAVTEKGCETGTHQCGGTCAALNDPNFGCGSNACGSCQTAHGTAACAGTACGVATCDKGYADCNGKASDGCEVDLSKPETCGACNAVCSTDSPLCAPMGDNFQCGGGCPAAAPVRCGNECVLTLTTVNHCGTCETKCPDVTNATAECSALGQCGFTCQPGYHACGTTCAADSDVNACGATCSICPPAANAVPACTGNACAFTCAENFGDCTPGDGCESALLTDPLHCGNCATNCNGGTCTNGVCSAPTDPDAGAQP